jgi:hypothetical protein
VEDQERGTKNLKMHPENDITILRSFARAKESSIADTYWTEVMSQTCAEVIQPLVLCAFVWIAGFDVKSINFIYEKWSLGPQFPAGLASSLNYPR